MKKLLSVGRRIVIAFTLVVPIMLLGCYGKSPSSVRPPSRSLDQLGPTVDRDCAVEVGLVFASIKEWQQTYVLTADCGATKQVLGGGFAISPPPGRPAASVNGNAQLTVTASYPSSPTAWTVVYYNHDPKPPQGQPYSGYNVGWILNAEIYALKPPYHAIMSYVHTDDPSPLDKVDRTIHTDPIPAGSFVTGGGFSTTYAPNTSPPASQLGFVQENTPDVGADGTAIGWHMSRFGEPTQDYPSNSRVYACVCSGGLEPGKVLTAPFSGTSLAFGDYVALLSCASDEFISCGGYRIINSGPGATLIGRMLVDNIGQNYATQWHVEAYDGYQIARYGPPTTLDPSASAVCIKLPAPQLTLQITSPVTGSVIAPQFADLNHTVPTAYTAIPKWGCTTVPADLQWKIYPGNVSIFGNVAVPLLAWSGNSQTEVFNITPGVPKKYLVTVQATYQGHTAFQWVVVTSPPANPS